MSVGKPTVRLLGPLRIRDEAAWVELVGDKRHLLLAYLAYAGAWVPRDRLAFLFWPDVTTGTARSRLRQLVRRVRRLPWTERLEVDRSKLRWPVATDVDDLLHALGSGDGARIVEAYGGPLLKGVSGDVAPELAAWLDVERAALHERWRGAVLAAAETRASAGDPARAASWIEAVLREDPLDEEALRLLMTASVEAGERHRARAAYESFKATLESTVGVEPAATTRRLAASLDEAPEGARLPSPARPTGHASYEPATRFVGRDAELLEIRSLLEAPECRLLTLLGLGGVGKSRLAWQTAVDWESPAHVVRLDALNALEDVPQAIAHAIDAGPLPDGDPVGALAEHLRNRRALLVLDNVEHLVGIAGMLARLVRTAPSLAILLTSRERLGIAEEWVFPVEGLRVPPPDEPADDAWGYDAVQLFLARAAQVRGGEALGDDELRFVVRICRSLHGLPLAIELAAARIRSVPVAALAEEVEADADVLTRRHDPDGHESLRAVFESSWRRLTDEERRALAALAVFVGGFTRAAARGVAGVATPVLGALADKSLLQLLPGGRYDRHPLLYRYMHEKLEALDDTGDLRRRHARFFLGVAEEARGRLRRPRDARDLDALEAEHENLRAALRWGLAHEPVLTLRMAASLGAFWEIRGHLAEGCGWLDAALERAGDAGPTIEADALEACARLEYLRGRRDVADHRSRAALAGRRRAGDDVGTARAQNQLGALALDRHDLAEAERRYREALAAFHAVDDRGAVGRMLNNLGEVARLQGHLATAEERYAEALALHEAATDERGVAIVKGNLGSVARRLGRPAEAAALLRASLRLKHRLGDEIGMAYNLAGLAGVLTDVGACADAARLLGAAERLLRERNVEFDAADRDEIRAAAARCRNALGTRGFDEASARGRAVAPDGAAAWALAATEAVAGESG